VLVLVLMLAVSSVACGERAPGDEPDAGATAAADRRAESRAQIGLALLREGHVEQSLEHFRKLGADPQQRPAPGREPSWLHPLLEQLIRRRELETADSILALCGSLEGRSDPLRYLSANLLVLQGRPEQAMAAYRSLEGDDPELRLRAHHELATLHEIRGEHEEAIAEARAGLALQPAQESLSILIARALQGLGRSQEALRELRSLPLTSSRLTAEGELRLEMDQPDSAVVALERALQTTPQIPHIRFLLGQALLRSGDARRAIKALEPLARRARPFPDSQAELSKAYRAVGRAEAADSLGSIVRDNERWQEAEQLRADGLRLSEAGELEEALDRFERALDLRPLDGNLHNDRGAVLARLGRYEEAERALRRAEELRPEDPVIQENLARLYDRMGDVPQREAAIRRWRALTEGSSP
jgi:tetratricopeptide (TPR) repeat protein